MNDYTNNEGNSVVAANSAGLILTAGAASSNLGRDGDRALISSQQQRNYQFEAQDTSISVQKTLSQSLINAIDEAVAPQLLPHLELFCMEVDTAI